jgi:dihydrofolate reductase
MEDDMRKVVVLNRITLDGFFAGPNGENDWFIPDPAVDAATHEMIDADTMLLGRVSYEHLEAFWPHVPENPDAPEGLRKMADEVNGMTKIVFSNSRKDFPWQNSRLVTGNPAKEVKALKQGEGSDLLILGSGTIIQQLANEGLIDEYVLIITPAVIGRGMPMFKDTKPFNLEPVDVRHFDSGNVVVRYKLAAAVK